MLSPDTVLQNRYRIKRELGRGGMGAVYAALDQRLGRIVALKETLVEIPELRKAFEREARLLANLRHPSLPNVLDHFSEGDGQFLVMEFIEGPDLAQLLKQSGWPIPLDRALKWSDELLDALEYLHSRQPPVVHRDIKPANLKISPEGRLILLDFGLAKGTLSEVTQTFTQSVVGYSSHYSPIEQILGERTSPASDLYSAGATLYHLLCGRPPLDARERYSRLRAGETDSLPFVNQLNRNVPDEVARVLARALEIEAINRPASAAELRARLRAATREPLPVTQVATPLPHNNAGAHGNAAGADFTPTMPVRPDYFVPPLAPNRTATAEASQLTHTGLGKWRWAFTALLGCALVAGLVILLLSTHIASRDSSSTGTTNSPTTPAVPAPFKEALRSIVALDLRDADGKPTGHASGFFVKEDEVATSLDAIAGASQGQVSLSDHSASFKITGVSAFDRERGLVTLKVSGAKGAPLVVNTKDQPNAGDAVSLLATSAEMQEVYAKGTITNYRRGDGTMDISTPFDESNRGGALVNERGEVVGIITGASTQSNTPRAVAAPQLSSLTKKTAPMTTLASAGAKELLYDFRQTESAKQEKPVPAEVQRRVLSAVFSSYLTDASQCSENTDYGSGGADDPYNLKAQRKAGQMVPSITSVAQGAFTEPGAQQTAYLIQVSECNAPHAANWGSKRLAVFNGQTLVADADIGDHTQILGAYDLNDDGINELLLTGAYMQSGEQSEWAIFADFIKGKFHIERKFDSTMQSDCASMAQKPSASAAVIYYTKMPNNAPPEFRLDYYRAKCNADDTDSPQPSAYKYVSSGAMPKS